MKASEKREAYLFFCHPPSPKVLSVGDIEMLGIQPSICVFSINTITWQQIKD